MTENIHRTDVNSFL